ncbi:MAG: zinc ABC transporter substrate-binding protein [Phycisphaerae bacterium]|nr:zinc ABC transporter substrate-binding protein [Phycisphaerae bacterium]
MSIRSVAVLTLASLYLLPLEPQALADEQAAAKLRVLATIHPIAEIVGAIGGERIEVVRLLSPGSSPHTYEPRPGDVQAAEGALALFYVSDELDGWATKLPARNKIELLEFLPVDQRLTFVEHKHARADGEHGHHHEDVEHEDDAEKEGDRDHGDAAYDPHFWTDPLAVRAILPALVEKLNVLDPAGADVYAANAKRFDGELESLHNDIEKTLKPVQGQSVFLYHPSFRYMLKRYGLEYGGAIEQFPGKEPSPKYLQELTQRLRAAHAKAIFTEPQLSRRPAEVVAREVNIRVGVLDPIGGVLGRKSYAEMIRYNASTLLEYLK